MKSFTAERMLLEPRLSREQRQQEWANMRKTMASIEEGLRRL